MFKVGVSKITPGVYRRLHRAGGADDADLLRFWTGAENCSELCFYGMRYEGLDNYWWQNPAFDGYGDPHYLKCFDAATSTPLNGLRIQHASQLDTYEIDPLVPKMNITDWQSCMRMSISIFERL